MNDLVTVDVVSRVWAAEQQALAEMGKSHGEDYVLSTGVPSLGEWVYHVTPGAIPLGKLAVVGGKTGNNKTRLLWNLAADFIQQAVNVGLVSLEIDAAEATRAIWSILTNVPAKHLSPGRHFDSMEAEHVRETIEQKTREGSWGRLLTNQMAASLTAVDDALGWMATMNSSSGVRVFLIDYFQLLSLESDTRHFSALKDAVRGIVSFMESTGSLVVVASQFNPQSSAPKVRPTIESLDSCPLLSKQAHFGWLLDHTRREDDEHITRTWLLVAKNRHGREGDIPIEIDYRTHRIRQALPDEEALWP